MTVVLNEDGTSNVRFTRRESLIDYYPEDAGHMDETETVVEYDYL